MTLSHLSSGIPLCSQTVSLSTSTQRAAGRSHSPSLHRWLCSAQYPESHSPRSCKAASTVVASSQASVWHGPSKSSFSPSPWRFAEEPSTLILETTGSFLFQSAQMPLQRLLNSASQDPAPSSRFFMLFCWVLVLSRRKRSIGKSPGEFSFVTMTALLLQIIGRKDCAVYRCFPVHLFLYFLLLVVLLYINPIFWGFVDF